MLLLSSCGSVPIRESVEQAPTPQPQPFEVKPLPTAPLRAPVPVSPRIGADGVRVALLVPLSGRHQALGDALLNAAQLALFDVQVNQLTLMPLDTKGTPAGAQAAMQQAVKKGAHLVLGPVFSGSIKAITRDAQQRGIPVIGFSTDRSAANQGIYVLGFTPEQQIDRIVNHAIGLGHYRFAALFPQTEFGDRMQSAFSSAISRRQAELIQVEYYTEDDTLLAEPVKRLANYDVRRTALLEEVAAMQAFGENDDLAREILLTMKNVETLGDLPFDAVLIPAGGAIVRSLAPLLPYYEIDPAIIQFLGTGLWDDPSLRLEPALHGARFAGPAPQAATNFGKRYQTTYEKSAPRIASLAYDATALAAMLMRMNKSQPFSQQALMNRHGFVGVDGIFRFGADGTAERRLAIIEIGSKGLHVVDEAISTTVPQQLGPPEIGPDAEPDTEDDVGPEPHLDSGLTTIEPLLEHSAP